MAIDLTAIGPVAPAGGAFISVPSPHFIVSCLSEGFDDRLEIVAIAKAPAITP